MRVHPFKSVFPAAGLLAVIVWLQSPACCPAQVAPATRIELATIDSDTRWTLQALAAVTVSSPIIRLEDVVKPLGAATASWPRLGRSPIGMFPVSTNRVTIDRERLDRVIRKAEATPRVIDWVGPAQIEVQYDPRALERRSNENHQASIATVAHVDYNPPRAAMEQPSSLSAIESQRIVQWILMAIKREHPEIVDRYDVRVDQQQASLGLLKSTGGITSLAPIEPIVGGQNAFRVAARSSDGAVEATVQIELTPLPQALVPRTTIGRGTRITERDLMLKPVADLSHADHYVTDTRRLVGMEARTTLRSGQPISLRDVGAPIVVHRGDLVEIRVLSGGVKVTTSAKALESGAESSLIEIETMRPRKRLVARVVQSGLVEIVTRAPSTRYREETR